MNTKTKSATHFCVICKKKKELGSLSLQVFKLSLIKLKTLVI